MKKKIISLIIFIMFSLVAIKPVDAAQAINIKINSDKTELMKNEQVVITLKSDNFNENYKGINAYKATLDYNKDIFEVVVQSDFESLNGWEDLKYNPENGEFVAIRKTLSNKPSEIVKITLKVKDKINASKTDVIIKDVVVSGGVEDIFLKDSNITLDIIKKQETIPTSPVKPEVPNQNNKIENNNNDNGVSDLENKTPDEVNPINPDNDEDKADVKPSENGKVKKTKKTYRWLYIFIFIQAIIFYLIFLWFKRKSKNDEDDTNDKNMKYSVFFIVCLLFVEFFGITVSLAATVIKKGELNDDGKINYADVSLLELHLVDLKKLPDNKLDNADMNGDGKITVTDLSFLIHKLENTLTYEASISSIESLNNYPNKNDNIEIKFNAIVSYGSTIKKVVIDGKEYDVKKSDINDIEYKFTINVGNTAGIRKYKITEAVLDNDKRVSLDSEISVDILKEEPSISNYQVVEDINNSKLIISFDMNDNEDSVLSSLLSIYDGEELIKTVNDFKQGKNRIEVSVEEGKEYNLSLNVTYDLDSDSENIDDDHAGMISFEKKLQLNIDYNFNISNIKTYKNDSATTLFENGDEVKLVFESTNATNHEPANIKIGEQEYEVTKENDKYVVTLLPLENVGNNIITIDEVILSNGKKFKLKENNSVNINVIKRTPRVLDFSTSEYTESNNLRVMFDLDDKDNAVLELEIILIDDNGNKIDSTKLNSAQLREKETSIVTVNLKTVLAKKYNVKVVIKYNTTGKEEDNVTINAIEEEVEADPQVIIKSITPNKEYIEKGGLLKLIYEVESNTDEEIVDILINNTKYIAVKLDDGKYEVTGNVGQTSGIYSLSTTKVYYSNDKYATVSNTTSVDVLKDKPSVVNYLQNDDTDNKQVTISFDIKDDENSFINGKVALKYNDEIIEENVAKGHNEITFSVKPKRIYNLEIFATYDLDSNSLSSKPVEDNRVVNEIINSRNVELVADYELTVGNIKTYNANGESKYFGKSEPINISFESTNATDFEPEKVIVRGKEYSLTKRDNAYYLTIDSNKEAGVQTAKIEKIILNNTQQVNVDKNNEIKVTVLKDKPTVEQFGYSENIDNTLSAKFNLVDIDRAMINGKIIIFNGDTAIKEQNLVAGENTITFVPSDIKNYVLKVIADYDLDMNVLEEDANEYTNITLLTADITIGNRKLEVKDIIRILVYKQTADGVEEVQELSEADLNNNLSNYIVKVRPREMAPFFTTINDYRVENNQLKLTLDYENAIQYENNVKHENLEVVYGTIVDGKASNISLETIIKEMELNPTGTFTLNQDYDASKIMSNTTTLIPSTFMGTLNGNGHTIYNLTKPLFDSLSSATIENLRFESVEISNVTSKGTIANNAENSTITNVHINGLSLTANASSTAGIIGHAANVTVDQSSVVNFVINVNRVIRVAPIVAEMDGGTISNCYAEGVFNSVQNKDGNGMGGILGHGLGSSPVTIENCITKIEFNNNVSPRLNGAIVGLLGVKNSIIRNNISLSTGTNFYSIHGDTPVAKVENNYELLDSGLTSNANENKVKQVAQENVNADLFKNANFDEDIWDLSNVSYANTPKLKVNKVNDSVNNELPSNNKLYIPDYSIVKGVHGYSKTKEVLYNNLFKLMPYYDSKYLVEDGLKFADNHELNQKIIRKVLPYSNGTLLTYLTSQNNNSITSIKVVFDDLSISEYNVTFKQLIQNIAIYEIEGLNIDYAYDNYVISEDASIVTTLTDYIKSVDYATTLEPLTAATDYRHYRDNYNETIKNIAQTIALQLLQNDADSVLTINNEILNNRIKQQLIDTGRINNILYGYNYYNRWYSFDINGTKVSDLLLFEGKMFKDSMTLDNLVNETLVGDLVPNDTAVFYINNLSKYTGISSIQYFLDYVISRIGGYSDVNDWFTEYFGSRNFLAEFGVDNRPELLYRGWYQLKKNSRMVLPVITMPSYSTYMISGPAHLQLGPAQLYNKDTVTAAGQKVVRNVINNHVTLAKRHFTVMAGGFGSLKWNNYCIMVYDSTRIITGYRQGYITIGGNKIPTGKIVPVYTQGRAGLNYPFFKNFSEVLGLWQPAGSSAGVGNTAGFLWFQMSPGLTNYDTWTHEFEHALLDKIMLNQSGFRTKLEDMTQGNLEQRDDWSENNLNQDVGPGYFNTSFYLNKEGNATQNLSPDRIDTKEEMENYFKGQQNALDLLDYIEGKAFIRLTPGQQAKIATSVISAAGRTTWRTITTEQAEQMNLTSLESLYDNKIILRPANAWGASVRGLVMPETTIADNYGYESVWVNRWYIDHYDGGYSGAFAIKRNFFEMLGYAGVEGYVIYGSRRSSSDLDAIRKITQLVTGTAMDWREYKLSRYATVEENLNNNKYIDAEYMIQRFTEALINDANNGDRNVSQRTNLRKIYYHYLKSATNDFIDDPLGTTVEVNHIKTAEELVQKINAQPYGYYVLDNDIDFSNVKTNVTKTFMGRLDGQGHKIIGNTFPIFNKIRYGYVGNIVFENTNIPKNISNAGALSYRAEMSTVENITAKNLQMNFGGRNDLSLIAGAVGNVITRNCSVEKLTYHITNADEFAKINDDPSGIYIIDNDIDFIGKIYTGSVITSQFTGKIDGNNHTLSNLTNASLFANFRGTIENLNINDFSNTVGGDFVTAFAKQTYNSTVRNIRFNNITLLGQNNVAVLSGMDGRENANSTFENISVKNAKVTGTGVYVSTFVGRKFGGIVRNIYVDGTLNIQKTESAGIIGASQENVIIENIVSNVEISRPSNGDARNQNGGFIGNIYNSPVIKNVISIGNVTGFTDNSGNEVNTYKFTGATENVINAVCTNCYEVKEATGISRVTENTAGHLDVVSKNDLNADFYRRLGFSDEIWNLDNISKNGYPELK